MIKSKIILNENEHKDVMKMSFQLYNLYSARQEIDLCIEKTRVAIELMGYSIQRTGNKTRIVFTGGNKLLCPDGRIRRERPQIRKIIEKMMKKENMDIYAIIKHIEKNKEKFTPGFITQARKIAYEQESLKKLPETILTDSKEYVGVAYS